MTILLMFLLGYGILLHIQSIFTTPKNVKLKNPMPGYEFFTILVVTVFPVMFTIWAISLVKNPITLYGGVIYAAYWLYLSTMYICKRQKAIDEGRAIYVTTVTLMDKFYDLIGAIFLCYLLYLIGQTIL